MEFVKRYPPKPIEKSSADPLLPKLHEGINVVPKNDSFDALFQAAILRQTPIQ